MFTALLLIMKRLFSKKEKPTIKNYTSNSALQTIIPNWTEAQLDQKVYLSKRAS